MAEPVAVVVNQSNSGPVVINEVEGATAIVNIGSQGPRGIPGSDNFYKYTQGSASAEWIIEHDLEKFPSVTVQDSADENVEGSVEYVDPNKIIIIFSAAFSGVAFLN